MRNIACPRFAAFAASLTFVSSVVEMGDGIKHCFLAENIECSMIWI